MNTVQVIGNLARDPNIRATKTGKAVASFTVCVNNKYTTPQGEQKDLTDYVNCIAWNNLAEAVGNTLRKGSRVFVEGRFTTRSYQDQSGQKRWISEVNANFIAVPLQTNNNNQQGNSQWGSKQYGGQQQSNGFSQFGNSYPDEDVPF